MNQSPGARLRSLIDQGEVIAPGAFNALVARSVAMAGFEAVYISGGATANVAGYPDTGLITLTEMCRTIQEVSQSSGLPVIVDADTGYGETESVIRTVVEYERHGAAALHLEDQVFPKRCGHLEGKSLISCDDMCEKIAAAVSNRTDHDMVIIARTDAAAVDGFDAAVARANAYRAAGADMIFPEGLTDEHTFAEMARRSPGWLLANMTEFGKTPHINARRFHEMGYQIVIYPLTMMRLAMGHVERGLKFLKENQTVEPLLGEMQTRHRLYETLDYHPGQHWPFPGASGRELRNKSH
jgi:methylisocitrate lyase